MRGLARLFTRFLPETAPDVWGHPRQTASGEVCIVQALPSQAELVRLGCGWLQYIQSSAFGVQIATALPAASGALTTPGLILWNGEPPGGKSYVIRTAGYGRVAQGVTTAIASVGVQVSLSNPISPPVFNVNRTPKSLSGSSYTGRAIICTNTAGAANTDSIPSEGFHQIGTAVQITTTQLVVEVDVYGRYIIPPRGAFSIILLGSSASVVNPTGASPLVTWFEVQFPQG